MSAGSEEVHIMSKISIKKGQTVIIPCLYDALFVNSLKYISSGTYFRFSNYVENKRLSILDNKTKNIFTATLRNAHVSDTGSYWCGVGVPGLGLDRGTHFLLEVTEGKIICL